MPKLVTQVRIVIQGAGETIECVRDENSAWSIDGGSLFPRHLRLLTEIDRLIGQERSVLLQSKGDPK